MTPQTSESEHRGRHSALGAADQDGAGRYGADQAASSAAFQLSQARSRSGAIAVVTTPAGLPVSVRIDNSQLSKQPQVLADEILRLCRQSAMAAGIRLRRELCESGASREVIDALNLPEPGDLARVEHRDDHEADATGSWLRPV